MVDSRELRSHYRSFLSRPEAKSRILLTGHSHQAWPDVALSGLEESFAVAAMAVDDKWATVFEVQRELGEHVARRIGVRADEVAFAPNTHELVVRWLSALPWGNRRQIVTTRGEFHSASRQLRRLAEEGVEVTWVDVEPIPTLTSRMAEVLTEHTSGVLLSTVLFGTSAVVPNLEVVTTRAREVGAEVLLDAYHAFDVVPFSVPEGAFLVAGGYKYAQWGEGVCFLCVPKSSKLRPAYTGWFAGFAELEHGLREPLVGYATDGATRFAGSTFDPASLFRARAVARFFDDQGLTPDALREVSLRHTTRIARRARDLGFSIATPENDADRGGFISLHTPHASQLASRLRMAGVFVDARGDWLRLGPAPYTTNDEIDRAMDHLGEAQDAK